MKIKVWHFVYMAALCLWLGFITGSLTTGTIFHSKTGLETKEVYAQIRTCEANLPRNLRCRVVVVKP